MGIVHVRATILEMFSLFDVEKLVKKIGCVHLYRIDCKQLERNVPHGIELMVSCMV